MPESGDEMPLDKPLDQMKKAELIAYAKKMRLDITYIGQRSAPELIALIREAEARKSGA